MGQTLSGQRELTLALPWRWYAACVDRRDREILLEDEPRFAGGAEMSLVHGDLSLVFDKARRAYSFTCYGDDGEGVRLTLEPFELKQIGGEFLAAREWSRRAGVK